MVIFPRNDDGDWPTKGQWRAVRDENKRRSAVLACPGCTATARINSDIVAADGTVKLTVACDYCDFHEFIKLDGWIPQ